MLERLQKIISAAGVTSRRAAEGLIAEGRVRVNGKVVTEPGTKADPDKDHIKVDGKLINPKQPLTYIMLNKPAGYVTTMSDPEGRPTVQDLLKGVKVRVYPVGRLDYNTEGMLILTNDGDFAHMVTHPKHEMPKTYRTKVKGVLAERSIEALEQGVYLDDGKTAPAKVKKVRKEEANSWLEITIHEGRKRQVRRMFDRVGHSVIRLKRIRTGDLLLGDLPEGQYRYLTPDEVASLKDLSQASDRGFMGMPVKSPPAVVGASRPATGSRDAIRQKKATKLSQQRRPQGKPWSDEGRVKSKAPAGRTGFGTISGPRPSQGTGAGVSRRTSSGKPEAARSGARPDRSAFAGKKPGGGASPTGGRRPGGRAASTGAAARKPGGRGPRR